MSKYHVCKDDIVKVNAGNFKGQEATVKAILPKKNRVVLELNQKDAADLKIGNRTVKKSQANPNGGLVQRSVSVQVSNVALTEESKKAREARVAEFRAKKAAAKSADGVK